MAGLSMCSRSGNVELILMRCVFGGGFGLGVPVVSHAPQPMIMSVVVDSRAIRLVIGGGTIGRLAYDGCGVPGAHSFALAAGESTAMGTRVGNFELILMQCW
jgi:hypothetical protein